MANVDSQLQTIYAKATGPEQQKLGSAEEIVQLQPVTAEKMVAQLPLASLAPGQAPGRSTLGLAKAGKPTAGWAGATGGH